MKKRLYIIIFAIMALYATVFAVIMFILLFVPSKVYDNHMFLAANFNSSSKANYKVSRIADTTTITCGKMQGMEIVWKYNAAEDMTTQMYYSFNVTSGKAKLILIQPDDNVVTIVEHDSNENVKDIAQSMVPLELKKGKNIMKIVCDKNTAFTLSFTIS